MDVVETLKSAGIIPVIVIDDDHRFVTLQFTLTGRGQLTVRDQPELLSDRITHPAQ